MNWAITKFWNERTCITWQVLVRSFSLRMADYFPNPFSSSSCLSSIPPIPHLFRLAGSGCEVDVICMSFVLQCPSSISLRTLTSDTSSISLCTLTSDTSSISLCTLTSDMMREARTDIQIPLTRGMEICLFGGIEEFCEG